MLYVKGHIISEGNLFDLNSSPKKQTKLGQSLANISLVFWKN